MQFNLHGLLPPLFILLIHGIHPSAAHGFVEFIEADGIQYNGYNPFLNPQPGPVAGWYADNTDMGFVSPNKFNHPDIICHRSASPGTSHVQVAAGSNITLRWTAWPMSHVGPIMDYLAPCPVTGGGGCTNVDKNSLKFVKIAQQALKPNVTKNTYWIEAWVVDDFLRKKNHAWTFTVPADLKAGQYVLRHEILALHQAREVNGAQAYPQCVNLNVTGGGQTEITEGVSPTEFYDAKDPGIHIDVYGSGSLTEYSFPGPTVWR